MILIVSCKQEQPTQVNYDKYAIQLDTNWVEVFDIDTVKICANPFDFRDGLVLKNNTDCYDLFEKLKSNKADAKFYPCAKEEFVPPSVDFDERFLLLYFTIINSTESTNRKVYYNKELDEYTYILEIISPYPENSHVTMMGISYIDKISLRKFTEKTKVNFDTIMTYKK
jgi:hypothetical protein